MKIVKSKKESKTSKDKYQKLCEDLKLNPDDPDQSYLVVTDDHTSACGNDETILNHVTFALYMVKDRWAEDDFDLGKGYLDAIIDSLESLQCKLFHDHDEEEVEEDDVCDDCREKAETEKKSTVN